MEASKPIDENPKEDIKEETKEDIKEETKKDIKEETKEEIKGDIKKTKSNKKVDYPYYRKFIKIIKPICLQTLIIIIVLLLYINLYNDEVYDFIIYFCFGLLITVMFIATFVMISKFNIISDKRAAAKINGWLFRFCNEFLYISQENTGICIGYFNVIDHILISIIAFIYVKKYIKHAKKTNNALLKSFILFCIWGIINIYFIDIIKIYNKLLKTTKTESTTAIISITLTYSGLVYYFDTLKNEKAELLSKLI